MFNNNSTLYFILNSIGTKRGGLAKAVLKRLKAICEEIPDRKVFLITLVYQRNIEEIQQEMIQSGDLHPNVLLVNILTYMDQTNYISQAIPKETFEINEDNYFVSKDTKRKNSFRYYMDGLYKKYKRFDKNGNLIFIDYMTDYRIRYKREEFSPSGQLVRIIDYDPNSKKEKTHRYIGKVGKCYLSIWLDDKKRFERCQYFGHDILEFYDIADYYTFVLNKIIENEPSPVIFSEFRDRLVNLPKKNLDAAVLQVNHPNVKKIAFNHSNHLHVPYTEDAKTSGVWSTMFQNMEKFNKLIFLTEKQKNHVIDRYGNTNNFAVIPHYVVDKQQDIQTKPDKNLFIMLSRIHYKKRVDDAIRIFKLVTEKNPLARLEIYGYGFGDEEEEKINQLIIELDLNDNVFLMGFTTNLKELYAKAYATVVTSRSEGFAMVITESLTYGTPVISYDINYGPSEIIQDGVNGFLIEDGNIEQFANKILELQNNEELRSELSINSQKITENFGYDKFVNNWKKLLLEVENDSPKPTLNLPNKTEVHVDTVSIDKNKNVEIKFILSTEDFTKIKEINFILKSRVKNNVVNKKVILNHNSITVTISKKTLLSLPFITDAFLCIEYKINSIHEFRIKCPKDLMFVYKTKGKKYTFYDTKHGNLSIKKEAKLVSQINKVRRSLR